jgi:hypothetical protein
MPTINSLKQQGLLISCSAPTINLKFLGKLILKYKLKSKQLERI